MKRRSDKLNLMQSKELKLSRLKRICACSLKKSKPESIKWQSADVAFKPLWIAWVTL